MPKNAPKPILIYVTASKRREAKKIADSLLNKRLVACVNMMRSHSLYRWKGKIKRSKEIVLFMKSDRRHMSAIVKDVKALSSYQTPCVVELSVEGGSKEYLAWSDREVR